MPECPKDVTNAWYSTIPLGRSGRSRTPLPPECGSKPKLRALRSYPKDTHSQGQRRYARPPNWPGQGTRAPGCDVGVYYA
jgi:hypothetical protein